MHKVVKLPFDGLEDPEAIEYLHLGVKRVFGRELKIEMEAMLQERTTSRSGHAGLGLVWSRNN